jgi:acetoin utilization protein AcuC
MPVLIYGQEYQRYDLGARHPFSPSRAEMTLDLIRELGLDVEMLEPEAATTDELCRFHDPDYVAAVGALSGGDSVENPERFGLGTADNPVVRGMDEGARQFVGGTLTGSRLILNEEEARVLQLGGGLHHAARSNASGFCIYNDLVIAINELVDAGKHVAYLDIDAHHCDGVQRAFYTSEYVMTISFHESPEFLFPGTGWVHELGRGMGRGHHLNIPLEPFTGGGSYLDVFDRVVGRALAWFRPDVLVVQAGADGHEADPLADLMLISSDYEQLYRRIVELADQYASGRLLVTLGGGYAFDAVARVWAMLALVLWDQPIPERVPEPWRRKWEPVLGRDGSATMHDPPIEPSAKRDEVAIHNRQTVGYLFDAVAGLWL